MSDFAANLRAQGATADLVCVLAPKSAKIAKCWKKNFLSSKYSSRDIFWAQVEEKVISKKIGYQAFKVQKISFWNSLFIDWKLWRAISAKTNDDMTILFD